MFKRRIRGPECFINDLNASEQKPIGPDCGPSGLVASTSRLSERSTKGIGGLDHSVKRLANAWSEQRLLPVKRSFVRLEQLVRIASRTVSSASVKPSRDSVRRLGPTLVMRLTIFS